MKAISLWQPWASLWVAGIKKHETRPRQTHYRGSLLVHAAKKIVVDLTDAPELSEIVVSVFGEDWAKQLPTMSIVGSVVLVDCRSTEEALEVKVDKDSDDYWCGNYAPGRFAWEAAYPNKYAHAKWSGCHCLTLAPRCAPLIFTNSTKWRLKAPARNALGSVTIVTLLEFVSLKPTEG